MRIFFEDADLEEYAKTGKSKSRNYRAYARNKAFTERLQAVLAVMQAVSNVSELSLYSFLKYEKLKHNYAGLSSVRIMNGRVERLIFREMEAGIEVLIIELNNTHYGNKK